MVIESSVRYALSAGNEGSDDKLVCIKYAFMPASIASVSSKERNGTVSINEDGDIDLLFMSNKGKVEEFQGNVVKSSTCSGSANDTVDCIITFKDGRFNISKISQTIAVRHINRSNTSSSKNGTIVPQPSAVAITTTTTATATATITPAIAATATIKKTSTRDVGHKKRKIGNITL